MKTYVHLWCYLTLFFPGWEMFRQSCRENQNTFYVRKHFSENRAIYEIIWKIWYSQTAHRLQCNTVRALWMLDNLGYTHTHTLGICNTHCFSTAKTVTRTRLNVTFIRTLPVLWILQLVHTSTGTVLRIWYNCFLANNLQYVLYQTPDKVVI